jgi:hypothetical protein
MANVDSPFGLRPVRHISGAPYNGAVQEFSTAAGNATAIFIGDPVTITGAAQTIDGQVYQDVAQAVTTGVVDGVVVGVKAVTHESAPYRLASTQRILFVATDPDLIFEIQEVSGGTALTATDSGLTAAFVVGTGSTTSGLSGVELNNDGEANTNTLDLKIIRPVNRADNEIGEHCKWLVRLNRHRYANQIAGV